jgi:phospholipid transport system transporter-binding protein
MQKPMANNAILKEGDVIRIQGELTFNTVMLLWKEGRSLIAGSRIVDLSEVSRADSAGVALLCEFKRCQRDLQFQHISEQLKNIIQLSGLNFA